MTCRLPDSTELRDMELPNEWRDSDLIQGKTGSGRSSSDSQGDPGSDEIRWRAVVLCAGRGRCSLLIIIRYML